LGFNDEKVVAQSVVLLEFNHDSRRPLLARLFAAAAKLRRSLLRRGHARRRLMSRPLLLSGFMATGKSAVGRAVAQRRGVSFLDLDEAIERGSGETRAQTFESEGESGFRRLESEVLTQELAKRGDGAKVIALGGGALLDRNQRIEILGRAVVVTLRASPSEILRRVQKQDAGVLVRPLLFGPGQGERVESLLAARSECYAEAHGSVETEGRELSAIAD